MSWHNRPVTIVCRFRVVDQQGRQVAGDWQPVPNSYYPADLWDAGEQVVQKHELIMPPQLPEGSYRILLSIYDLGTGQPLLLSGAESDRSQGDQLELYDFKVKKPNANRIFVPLVSLGRQH